MRYWLAVPLLLGATPAFADWQFTRWGMTPEEVIAASNGTATAVKDEKKQRVRKLPRLAVGQAKEGDTTFDVEFFFENKKLRLIRYNPTGAMDCDGEEAFLLKHFGPADPTETVEKFPSANRVQLRMRERRWSMPSGDRMEFNIINIVRPDMPQIKVPPMCVVVIEPAAPKPAAK